MCDFLDYKVNESERLDKSIENDLEQIVRMLHGLSYVRPVNYNHELVKTNLEWADNLEKYQDLYHYSQGSKKYLDAKIMRRRIVSKYRDKSVYAAYLEVLFTILLDKYCSYIHHLKISDIMLSLYNAGCKYASLHMTYLVRLYHNINNIHSMNYISQLTLQSEFNALSCEQIEEIINIRNNDCDSKCLSIDLFLKSLLDKKKEIEELKRKHAELKRKHAEEIESLLNPDKDGAAYRAAISRLENNSKNINNSSLENGNTNVNPLDSE